MKTPYIQIEISLPDDLHELFIAELSDYDFDGFEQLKDRLIAWIPENRMNDVTREEIEQLLMRFGSGAHIIAEKREEPRNWNAEWESTIKSMKVGRFLVKPTWEKVPEDEDLITLEIDPKMAFGTGYHETTRLMLRIMPDNISKGDFVIDAGTGTGILAIAAIKLGADRAFGFDIDEWSYENAIENIWLNGVQDKIEIKEGGTEQLKECDQADVIIANINTHILVDIADELLAKLRPRGILLLSGLLTVDEQTILSHPEYRKLSHKKTITEGDWIAMSFRSDA